jgi:branched-chain amino acid transport system substrate-binding protein
LQALSGKVAPLGQAQLRGLELALGKRENMLLGHSIVLQIEDTGCTQEGGANAALKVIADPQTIAIFGSTCSGAAATASQAMSVAGLTMISGNNSAPFLTSIAGGKAPNWQAGFFRTAPNEEYAGKTAADYVFLQLGLREAATIHANDIYTRGLTESFKKAFTELGGEIVLDTAINKGETEMEPVLTAVINSAAQLLFFPLFQPEGNNILLQSRALPALDKTLLISGGALIEKSFLADVGEVGKGMYFVGPSNPEGAVVDQLTAAYEMKFKELPTVDYYLSGYDAAALLFHAIEQVTIQEKDGTLHLGRTALRENLYATTGFKGVTGTLSCNQFGDCARPAFDVLRLDDPSQGLEGLQSNKVFSSMLEN